MPDHHQLSNFIWQIADLLRGPYRPPQYERVMFPLTVLRRFDCVLASTKEKVLAAHRHLQGRFEDEALDAMLNKAAGQRFHNRSPLDFEKLKGDPNQIEKQSFLSSAISTSTPTLLTTSLWVGSSRT